MKIAWYSNAPWTPSGYGMQTAQVTKRLLKNGHEVLISANCGLYQSKIQWEGMDVYPHVFPEQDKYGVNQINNVFLQEKNKKHLHLTLYDIYPFDNELWNEIPLAQWAPIDHKTIPDQVEKKILSRAHDKYFFIAMSRFGLDQVRNLYFEKKMNEENLFYIPHSVETDIFKPEAVNIRSEISVPEDVHLTFINAANVGTTPVRKCWPEMLLAWKYFSEKRKDAYLYIHTGTDESDVAAGLRFPIIAFMQRIKMPFDRVSIVNEQVYKEGVSASTMASLYASSDVHLMTSRGEGFGVPTIEAQACGVPVIVTDWTAQTEVAGVGWLVGGQPEFDHVQGGWWRVPNIDQIVDALNDSYAIKSNSSKKKSMSLAARQFAMKYDTDVVFDRYWKPTMKIIEEKL